MHSDRLPGPETIGRIRLHGAGEQSGRKLPCHQERELLDDLACAFTTNMGPDNRSSEPPPGPSWREEHLDQAGVCPVRDGAVECTVGESKDLQPLAIFHPRGLLRKPDTGTFRITEGSPGDGVGAPCSPPAKDVAGDGTRLILGRMGVERRADHIPACPNPGYRGAETIIHHDPMPAFLHSGDLQVEPGCPRAPSRRDQHVVDVDRLLFAGGTVNGQGSPNRSTIDPRDFGSGEDGDPLGFETIRYQCADLVIISGQQSRIASENRHLAAETRECLAQFDTDRAATNDA